MQTTRMPNSGSTNQRSLSIVLKDLPKYPVPKKSHSASKLIIHGEVRKPTSISLERLRSLPMVKLSEDFKCLEGWSVKDVLWEGVTIESVLQIPGLKKSAKFLLFRSGDYTLTMSLKKALRVTTVLALKKSGRWLERSSGGPVRLVSKGHSCYESVKRVDRIDVLKTKPVDTARSIALARISPAS